MNAADMGAGLWQVLSRLYPWNPSFAIEAEGTKVFGVDMSIESLRSQEFSYYIFGFLVLSLIVFSIIIYIYLPRAKGQLKTGEKIMFGAIMAGVVIALAFGWLQLVKGYLV